jgi:integrase
MARLLYGGGLRLLECVRLRIKDVDFGQGLIYVLGKGEKYRTTVLPQNLHAELQTQVEAVKALHYKDLEEGFVEVYIPDALARKYPNVCKESGWQWLFPARQRSADPHSGRVMRHHVLESGLQKAVKQAVRKAGIDKKVSCITGIALPPKCWKTECISVP